MSEQEAITQIKKFLTKWSTISFQVSDSPGPLYTAGIEALASIIRAEAKALEPALEALADTSSEAWRKQNA